MLQLLVPAIPLIAMLLVTLLTEVVKRFILPQMQHWPAYLQQGVVLIIATAVVTGGASVGLVLPEGEAALSTESLTLLVQHLLTVAAGAMGLHGVVLSPRQK